MNTSSTLETRYVTSADGTRIAYDDQGTGPAVILIGGAMQFRGFDPLTAQLAAELAQRGLRVINYDRRGRGDSGVGSASSLAGEVEDLAALIEVAGGSAALYGSSSGGSIALAAAASGLAVTKLALWEVPLSESGAADFVDELKRKVAVGDGDATQRYFMKDMPPEWLEQSAASPAWPTMVAMSPSLIADAESLAWTQSAPLPSLLQPVTQPVLVLVGSETIPMMVPAADALLRSLPNGRRADVAAADHRWQLEAMVGVLAEFLLPGATQG